jgi:universal stress protein E
MQGYRSILVGVNLAHADRLAAEELDAPTREAIKRGIWLAERLRAKITFFSAIDVSAHTQALLHDDFGKVSQTVDDEGNRVLQVLVAEARQAGVAADCQLKFGGAWQEIIHEVQRANHDLVVLGTRDLGLAQRMLVGSTANKLLRLCPSAVWVTRPDHNWDDLNILIASDFSDVSIEAVHKGVNAGRLAEGKVHMLHALEHQHDSRLWHSGVNRDKLEEYHEKARTEAEHLLHDQLSQTDYRTLKHGVQVHVKEGPADMVILDAIEKFDIDVLVMGTVARSGISGLFIGNTAERLLPELTCSVLAIKPDGFVCPITQPQS